MDRGLLASCVERGLSSYQMTKIFNKSQTSIRYWLKKYNLKTKHKSFKDKPLGVKINKNNQFCVICGIKQNCKNSYLKKDRNHYSNMCKKCFNKVYLEKRVTLKNKSIFYKGGRCQKCGYNKNLIALEFHHIDPNKKDFNPSQKKHISFEIIKNELDKCMLLCSNCHREEHSRIYDLKIKRMEYEKFTAINFSESVLTGKNTNMESCVKCDLVLNESNSAKNKLFRICRKCDSKRMILRTQDRKKWAVEYMGGSCHICGYNKCIRALEFHHINPKDKDPNFDKFDVWPIEKKKIELGKCMLVCVNCHREIHSKDDHYI